MMEFGVAAGDVAFFCGPSMVSGRVIERSYSIASFMIRCLFGSDGSVIPSNCTIRAILNIM